MNGRQIQFPLSGGVELSCVSGSRLCPSVGSSVRLTVCLSVRPSGRWHRWQAASHRQHRRHRRRQLGPQRPHEAVALYMRAPSQARPLAKSPIATRLPPMDPLEDDGHWWSDFIGALWGRASSSSGQSALGRPDEARQAPSQEQLQLLAGVYRPLFSS